MIIYGDLFDEIMLQMLLVYEDHVKYVKEKIRKPCFMDEKQFILFFIKSVEMDSQIASHMAGRKNVIVPPQQGSGMWMWLVCTALFPRAAIQRES